MLMIRYQRIGRRNDAAFRIVVLEKARAAKSGHILAQVGSYNPRSKALNLDTEAIKNYLAKGAQPTASIHNLLIEKGVLTGKKINILPAYKAPETAADQPAAETAEAVPEPKADEVVEAPEEEAATEEAPAP